MINLLTNAIKFTLQGSVTLHVSTHKQSHVLASHTPPPLYVPYGQNTSVKQENPDTPSHSIRFEVIDTGKGIPANQILSLFDAFTQATNDQQFQEGTGLGLPISQHYVQAMNGIISVTSEVGKGSTFAVEIPLHETAYSTRNPKQTVKQVVTLAPGQPDYRILVVEDMWTNRTLITHMLESVNFQVKAATNGQEGIDTWNEWHPHLIFMDIRMPGMDGYEATRTIKATPHGRQTIIIALTAGAFEEERAIVLDAGCDDFIRKPFRETDIFEAIHKHLGVDYVYRDENQNTEGNDNPTEFDISHTSTEDPSPATISLDVIPATTAEQLHHAALLGDIDAVIMLIEEISTEHPSIGKALRTLASNFQFQNIVAMTELRVKTSL
ncbi:MAG: response regulator [Chloroflexaceae bacterium]|nr:response regulator [Chloroflexaceae bacterium]